MSCVENGGGACRQRELEPGGSAGRGAQGRLSSAATGKCRPCRGRGLGDPGPVPGGGFNASPPLAAAPVLSAERKRCPRLILRRPSRLTRPRRLKTTLERAKNRPRSTGRTTRRPEQSRRWKQRDATHRMPQTAGADRVRSPVRPGGGRVLRRRGSAGDASRKMKAFTEPGPLGPDVLQLPDSPAGGSAVTEASDRWVGHTFDATSGRGLVLVDTLATAWGTELVRDGKMGWVELHATGHAGGEGRRSRPVGS